MKTADVGFIGLGAMGAPMAENISKAPGVRLHVYDRSQEALARTSAWAQPCASPAEVAKRSDIVISMLPADAHVRAVALDSDGLIAGGKPGLVYADFSTISPLTIKEVANRLETAGIETIGGSCTLGVASAKAGTLAVYVDGPPESIDCCRPVVERFASKIMYVGALGNAKLIKLMNNHLIGVNVALIAEALLIGSKAGIDPETLVPVLCDGSADSYALRNHFAKYALADDLGPGKFGTDYIVKDLNILLDYCRTEKAPAPLCAIATSLYRGASSAGYGSHYFPVVMSWLRESLEQRA